MGPRSLEAAPSNQKILPPSPQGTFVITGDILVVTTWGGGCCWCSGGTGQAGCSMPAACRTVHTKDCLAQKVHSADREKPCPQVARGPVVRRTLPGLLTLFGAGSLVQSSPLPSDETPVSSSPLTHPAALCAPQGSCSCPLPGCSSPRCSHCLPLPCCRSLFREPFLATSSPSPLLFLPGSLTTRSFFAFLTRVGCLWTENPSTGFVPCLIPRVWTRQR